MNAERKKTGAKRGALKKRCSCIRAEASTCPVGGVGEDLKKSSLVKHLFFFLLLSIGTLSLSTDDSPTDLKITCSPGEAMCIAHCSKRDHCLDSLRSIVDEG